VHKRGFSLRNGAASKQQRNKRERLPLLEGDFSVPRPPTSSDPGEQFRYLQSIVNALGHVDDPRCQDLRAGIVDVVKKVAAAIDAIGAKRPSRKQVEAVAKRAERALDELRPEIFEATYFLAHRYLSRHRTSYPEGSDGALTAPLYAALTDYAAQARDLGAAMRAADEQETNSAWKAFESASEAVRNELVAAPPAVIGPE
jgi:hypothetical protein